MSPPTDSSSILLAITFPFRLDLLLYRANGRVKVVHREDVDRRGSFCLDDLAFDHALEFGQGACVATLGSSRKGRGGTGSQSMDERHEIMACRAPCKLERLLQRLCHQRLR